MRSEIVLAADGWSTVKALSAGSGSNAEVARALCCSSTPEGRSFAVAPSRLEKQARGVEPTRKLRGNINMTATQRAKKSLPDVSFINVLPASATPANFITVMAGNEK